jgi:hypothetical protein
LENQVPNDPRLAERLPPPPGKHCDQTRFWGLVRRRTILLPTFRGCLIILLATALVLFWVFRGLHPFLAVNDPISDGILVVEGWTPDYGMELARDTFRRDHYDRIYVTGGPIEYGMHLSAFQTYAQLGAATLVKLGLDSNVVQAVPGPLVIQDRTYYSALSLKKWLLEHGITPTRILLLSDGPHTRRSRLLYQMAMGKAVKVGSMAIPPKDYDEKHWWRYSAGVRSVISESVAYVYARFLFFPPKQ